MSIFLLVYLLGLVLAAPPLKRKVVGEVMVELLRISGFNNTPICQTFYVWSATVVLASKVLNFVLGMNE